MRPIVTRRTIQICKETWDRMLEPLFDPNSGYKISGLTAFYNAFYEVLSVRDRGGKFDDILMRYATGMTHIAAKGAILVRIMNFTVGIDPEDPNSLLAISSLGKSHCFKSVRPWQYSVFMTTMLEVIASKYEDYDIVAAWTNLFAFLLLHMLPAAIKGVAYSTELDVNVPKANAILHRAFSTQNQTTTTTTEENKLPHYTRTTADTTNNSTNTIANINNNSVVKKFDEQETT
jgi:hypothetical protein